MISRSGLTYGLNLPPGATIVKRLVPVPVGTRIGVPRQTPMHFAQQHLPPAAAAAATVAVDMRQQIIDPLRTHKDKVRKEKRKGEPESPMPLTEDEFYLWQKQFKKRFVFYFLLLDLMNILFFLIQLRIDAAFRVSSESGESLAVISKVMPEQGILLKQCIHNTHKSY